MIAFRPFPYVGEGSAVRGGSRKFFLGGEGFFGFRRGGGRFDLKGGGRGGKCFFWPLSAANKIPDFVKKPANFLFFLGEQ